MKSNSDGQWWYIEMQGNARPNSIKTPSIGSTVQYFKTINAVGNCRRRFGGMILDLMNGEKIIFISTLCQLDIIVFIMYIFKIILSASLFWL